ncbi:MAG: asparagine synthase (glutamine-hydrolyzing), partial [bacterium]
MCGICGIINYDKKQIDPYDLQSMNDAMLHRGPDDHGYYYSENKAFAMRRLSIIDLEGGQQPVTNEDSTVWVIQNGEIYNYIELRRELKNRGHVFKTTSDTEVIVHLFEEKGINALDDLNGMYALAIYDKNSDLTYIARDRLGIKPLYYFNGRKRFIFSSDLNSIRKIEDLKINSDSLLSYLGLSYVPAPETIYHGIRKVRPAHYIVCNGGQIEEKRYWSIENIQVWEGSLEQASGALRELLIDAVGLQFRSDVPVGVFLSGGLDSSAILAAGAQAVKGPINTFTINFEQKNGQDSFFARKVASKYNTCHVEKSFNINSFLTQLDELLYLLDEPVSDTAIIPTYFLSKIARQNGIKVLLSGAGGDELFGGYPRQHKPGLGTPRWFAENMPFPLRMV